MMLQDYTKKRVRIKQGWLTAGKTGIGLGEPIFIQQWWLPVLWEGEEDPDFHKLAGLECLED